MPGEDLYETRVNQISRTPTDIVSVTKSEMQKACRLARTRMEFQYCCWRTYSNYRAYGPTYSGEEYALVFFRTVKKRKTELNFLWRTVHGCRDIQCSRKDAKMQSIIEVHHERMKKQNNGTFSVHVTDKHSTDG